MVNGTTAVRHHWVTLKSLFVPLLVHPRAAQFIKYAVYASLTVNFYFYVLEDWQSYRSALPEDATLGDLLTNFSTSIDTIAWLGLIVLFELETYTLPDEAFTRRITLLLHAGRGLCYLSILFAAYGYTAEALDAYTVTLVEGVRSLCQVVGQGIALQIDQVNFIDITAGNCTSLSGDTAFYHLDGEVALVGESTLPHLHLMGVLDIINAYAWLLVVALIEVEVWLQAHDRFASKRLLAVRLAKSVGYLVLIADGVIWGISGYYLWAWDAFLWIFGFWAIEFNLAYWEKLRLAELAQTKTAPGGAASPG